jgi:TolB-like protein
MKHLLKEMGFLLFMVIILAGCGSSPKAEAPNVQGISVDMAIQQAARNIENNIEAGQEVVVLNFSSSSEEFSEYVLGELSTELVNGRKLQVVDRRNLEAIRVEMDFQMSGEVSDESAQAIGRKLGAEYIVSGSLTNTGGIYRFRINTINVESAGIAASSATDIANDSKVQALLASGGGVGSGAYSGTQTVQRGNAGGNTTAPTPATPVPAAPVYKIGDTGPAGGFVFYDKGNNSGGWRYLEAAPEDINRQLYATEEGVGIESQRAVGTGKANTQAIMVQANNRGGGFGWAAQACDALELNGFDDWFLPSRDELHYMYGNLHMRNLGGFSLGWYWSSTYSGYKESGFLHGHFWWCENFSDGKQAALIGDRDGNWDKPQKFRVRACRQF